MQHWCHQNPPTERQANPAPVWRCTCIIHLESNHSLDKFLSPLHFVICKYKGNNSSSSFTTGCSGLWTTTVLTWQIQQPAQNKGISCNICRILRTSEKRKQLHNLLNFTSTNWVSQACFFKKNIKHKEVPQTLGSVSSAVIQSCTVSSTLHRHSTVLLSSRPKGVTVLWTVSDLAQLGTFTLVFK